MASKGLGTNVIIGIIITVIAVVVVVIIVVLFATGAFGGTTTGDGNGNNGNGNGGDLLRMASLTGLRKPNGDFISPGSTTTERIVSLVATVDNPVSDPSEFHGRVKLFFNGEERYVDVDYSNARWVVDADLVLKAGTNTFKLYVIDDSGQTIGDSEQISITANIDVMAIRAVLTWDTDLNDLDMHLWDGDNDHAWYRDLDGIPGGQLDLDDTDGYGPETFTQENAASGTYTIKVRYYSTHGQSDPVLATVRLTINEGMPQRFTHTFYSSEADGDDSSNDWTVTTFSVS